MTPFTQLTGIGAPLPLDNVDTDQILPGQFLKTIHRTGLSNGLFARMRADPGFVLNQAPWNRASILIARENFACGSSREHAPWALLDFGIRCVIAAGIADIFYNNCVKNGILPIILERWAIDDLLDLVANPASAQMTVDLEEKIVVAGGRRFPFEISAQRRRDLLAGVDEIARSLSHENEIARHEDTRAVTMPWLPAITQDAVDAAGAGLL